MHFSHVNCYVLSPRSNAGLFYTSGPSLSLSLHPLFWVNYAFVNIMSWTKPSCYYTDITSEALQEQNLSLFSLRGRMCCLPNLLFQTEYEICFTVSLPNSKAAFQKCHSPPALYILNFNYSCQAVSLLLHYTISCCGDHRWESRRKHLILQRINISSPNYFFWLTQPQACHLSLDSSPPGEEEENEKTSKENEVSKISYYL